MFLNKKFCFSAVLTSVTFFAAIVKIESFNINLDNALLISDDKVKGTLFGFSTALYHSDGNTIGAFIGAPQANTTNGGQGSGTVHTYKDVFKLPRENLYQPSNITMPDGSKNERFGSTVIAVDSKNYLICGPQWKDTQNISSNYFTYVPGRCVLNRPVNSSVKIEHFNPYFEKIPQRKYVKEINSNHVFWRALATYGFSADFDGSVLAVGAPGISIFEGAVHVHDFFNRKEFEFKIKEESNLNTTSYSYLGYSVKIGKLCREGLTGVCFAAGAPNMFSTGQVKILNIRQEIKHIMIVQEINGTELWSNFGYSLVVINVQNDQYDELLVGAPLYTEWKNPNHIPDQGSVYQYVYDSQTQTYERHGTILDGSKQPFARFGSAIANLGDINLDQFLDIAISAPGENDGAGSIYIYLGTATGFSNSPSQRILASKLLDTLKGLGFSFSNNQVPLGESYPVFAASSVESDTVAIFQCRPIVEVSTDLSATPNPVDIEKSCSLLPGSPGQEGCFKVTFCLKHKLKGKNFQALNYSIQIEIDTKTKVGRRALLRLDNNEQNKSINKTQFMISNATQSTCMDFIAILKKSAIARDRFTPITIVATYQLEPTGTPARDPVLDATKFNNKTAEVTFVNECGSDAKCEMDLSLNANLFYVPADVKYNEIVVNYTKEIAISFEIKNKNEVAYGIVVNVEIDSFVSLIKSKSDPSCESKASEQNTTEVSALVKSKKFIVCSFFEPLDSFGEIKANLFFSTDEDNVKRNDLIIKIDAMPKSPDHNPEINTSDNGKTLSSKVFIISNLIWESISFPNENTIYDAKSKPEVKTKSQENNQQPNLMNVTHKILVRNQGPSFLPKTIINVAVPFFLTEKIQLVEQADVKMLTSYGNVFCEAKVNTDRLVMASTTTTSTSTQQEDLTAVTHENGAPPVNRRRRSVDKNCHEKTCILGCQNDDSLCQIYVCDLGSIVQPKSIVEINITMVLDLSSLVISEEYNTLEFRSQVEVLEPKHPLFKSWGNSRKQETITTFHFLQSGGKINIWIIVGSIIGGLVLITIIVIVLWKIGFFKRTKHLEIQQMKRESMRRSLKVTPKANSDD